MRRHAKAPAAGLIEGNTSPFRHTLTTRGVARRIGGSGAPSGRRALHAALVLLALACLQLAVLVPGSQAAVEPTPTYVPGAFFGSQGSEPGQFNEPGQIASEPGTGNLLVADTGNGRVQVFSTDAEGNPAYLTSLGEGTIVNPAGIAIDQSTGAIYVSDSGANQIFRFTSDGAPTPTYTLDPTFTSPTEVGSFASTLAVDPTTHDLIVADTGSQEIRRFDVADGHLIKAFNGSTSPGGQFTSLRSVAVAPSGTIYVVDELYPGAAELEPNGARVERFDAAGEPLGQLQGLDQQGAVGIEPGTGKAVVTWHNYFEYLFRNETLRLSPFEGSDSPLFSVNFPHSVEGGTVALTIADDAPHRVYVLLDALSGVLIGRPGIQSFKPADIPAAEIGPTSAVDTTSAHVSGSVAPGTLSGTGTTHFEYSLDGDNWDSTPDQSGIAGPGETAVSADLADLRPNSTYSVRLKIENDDSASTSAPGTFTTSPVPPAVDPLPVSGRGSNSVVLNGRVNPFGQQTTYRFEYGPSAAYGHSTPVGPAGKGYSPRSVSAALSGLTASTAYHYRLVAENATGSSATPDATFTTRAASEPSRSYEQVTPVDKHGMTLSVLGPYQAALDGNAILYSGRSAMNVPDTASSTVAVFYAGIRSPSGWGLRQVDVAQRINYSESVNFESTYAVSADFSHALVGGLVALTPGAIEGTRSLYRRDLETGRLELVATGLTYAEFNQLGGIHYYGGTPNFSRILFTAEASLTPDALPGFEHLYEWTVGQGLQLISKAPDGTQFSAQNDPGRPPVVQFTSSDASRVYMATWEGVYLRENGVTTQISPPGEFTRLLGVTSDGRYVAYFNFVTGDIYRYDRDTDTIQLVTNVPDGIFENHYLGMSTDGSSIFWESLNTTELYVWHDGVVKLIGAADDINGYFRYGGTAISPDGRYFEFSSASLAGQSYDNRNASACAKGNTPGRCTEVYIYDTEEESLTCISCSADGSRSTGQASIRAGATISRKGPLTVNDKGQAFFDTPTSLVAADSNGRRDVYEFQDGELRLVSPGSGDYEARLADVSADGSDVFFSTEEGLVAQDTDRETDVYDARVGGGIASQGAVAAPACSGSDCRAPAAAPITVAETASEAVSGQGQSQQARPRPKHKKRKAHHRKAGAHHKKARSRHGKGRAHQEKSKTRAKARSHAQGTTFNRNLGK